MKNRSFQARVNYWLQDHVALATWISLWLCILDSIGGILTFAQWCPRLVRRWKRWSTQIILDNLGHCWMNPGDIKDSDVTTHNQRMKNGND